VTVGMLKELGLFTWIIQGDIGWAGNALLSAYTD